MHRLPFSFLLALVLASTGCQADRTPHSVPLPPSPYFLDAPVRVEAAGLHNVYRLGENLYSGSSPEGDAGFASLSRLGVKTVISVDGARPDVERARGHGLRYIHLPVGYDGVPGEQALRLARAVRDLPGPVYVHCHHGKHRGPAAAAVAALCVDSRCTIESALAWMRRAGTDPRYTGLYAAAREVRRPTKEELDLGPDEFPEVAEVQALAQLMVEVDGRWEHLRQIREAGWKAPPDHPDLDPAHEALLLVEHYRESARLPGVQRRTEEFRRWLTEAEAGAKELEGALRASTGQGAATGAGEQAFRRASEACARCHARYRDVPQRRESSASH